MWHNPSALSLKGEFSEPDPAARKLLKCREGNLDLDLSENASEVLTAAKISVKDSKCQKKGLQFVFCFVLYATLTPCGYASVLF